MRSRKRSAKSRALETISLSIAGWCEQTGMNYETVRVGLIARGHETGTGATFTLRQLVEATSKRGDFERTRKDAAMADKIERENREAAHKLIPDDELDKIISETWGPPRQFVVSMPAEYAERVRPDDPQAGREALEVIRDDWLKLCKEVAK